MMAGRPKLADGGNARGRSHTAPGARPDVQGAAVTGQIAQVVCGDVVLAEQMPGVADDHCVGAPDTHLLTPFN